MKKQLDIIAALKNPKLFGSLFPDLSSWAAWFVFLKATFGLEMDERELELFMQCTGRTEPPEGGAKESYAIVGRRGGKSRMISFAGVFIACFHDFKKYLAAGETGMVLILARDRDQSKIVFGYIAAIIESVPALRAMVLAWRADEIELSNGIVIAVKASDFRSVRGVTLVAAIADEVCFWDSQGVSPDVAVFQALRPAMATVPEAKLLVISSPYAKFGIMFETYRRYYGQNDPNVLMWQADTRTMNPTISQEFIDEEMARDPEAGRSEWLGLFRDDLEQAFSLESIESCVVPGRTELLPAQSLTYVAFVDPSGGRRDQFTVTVAHRSGDKAVVDTIRAWKPPFDPAEVTKECAEVLKPYRITAVTGDAYGGEWPREQFRKHNIQYNVSEVNRSQLYLNLIPAVNSKRVELPDDRKMIDELRRLERRRGRSGKDSVDHPNYGGSDDIANSVAGAIDLVAQSPGYCGVPLGIHRLGGSPWRGLSVSGPRRIY